jgi:site-specific recombinase XerD
MRREFQDFLDYCRIERRLAPLTCSAYERDVGTCIGFLEREGLVTVGEVRPLHLRRLLGEESVQTGLRRAELIALDWADLELEAPRPSLLVRCGKGGTPRRQPLAPALAHELALLRAERNAAANTPVFCGLEGKRLQPTILAGIIRRAADGAAIEKRVTAHTLRHTAATWLRQQTGDARLVAAYLGHADLSTVRRYAHVAADELHEAAAAVAARTLTRAAA